MGKYYEAYDKRYKQIHSKGLTWATNTKTDIVETIIKKYHLETEDMLEIGCGEGRDVKYLLDKNYKVLATDISQEAINYCQQNDLIHKDNYIVLNVLNDNLSNKFGFIYSVACLHMLVLDEDRNKFYKFIHHHLKDNGYALILTMGDGINESKSDISRAFKNVKRIHQESSQEIEVAMTSCRTVSFATLLKETNNCSLKDVEHGITEIKNHFNKIMYILVKKDQ